MLILPKYHIRGKYMILPRFTGKLNLLLATTSMLCSFTTISASNPSCEGGDIFVKCNTSFYDGKTWSELGTNQTKPGCGKLDFSYGGVRFSAVANIREELMYFCSIYDDATKTGTQLQLSKNKEIWLYFLQGQSQYAMNCKIES